MYLLIDFISARWDKSIAPETQALIRQICEIGWPPDADDRPSLASQAATLLHAKDLLDTAAPAAAVAEAVPAPPMEQLATLCRHGGLRGLRPLIRPTW